MVFPSPKFALLDAHTPLTQVDFNSFLEKNYIDVGGAVIAAAVAIGLAVVFLKWRDTLVELAGARLNDRLSGTAVGRLVISDLVVNVLYQKPLADCSRTRWAMHFMTFWGFILLALATTLDAIMNPAASPLPLLHPVRVVGNVGGTLFLVGLVLFVSRYVGASSVRRASSLGDFTFLALLLLVTLSGFITEFLSETTTVSLDSFAFWSHLILVAGLLVTAPFTKFAHAVGRPALLLVKRMAEARSGAKRRRP